MARLLCALMILPSLATADECRTSQILQEDGRTTLSQTDLAKKKKFRLVNHALSLTSAVSSGFKMVSWRCVQSPITPSFYLYNGSNVVDGVNTVAGLLTHKKESKEILKASLSDNTIVDTQIKTFERAYEEQMKAYKSAKRKANIARITGLARKTAVGMAGVEWGMTKIVSGPFLFQCAGPSSGGAGATSAAGAGADNNPGCTEVQENSDCTMGLTGAKATPKMALHSLVGSGIQRTVTKAVAKFLLKEKVGEVLPATRLVLYGAQEIFAKDMAKDMKETAHCMKKRAKEYKAMADSLRQRGQCEGAYCPPSNEYAGLNEGPGENLTPPHAPCVASGSDGRLIIDQQCACAQTNSCHQIPTPNEAKLKRAAAAGSIPLPPGLLPSLRAANKYINGVMAGRSQQANLAANQMGQGAASLDRSVKAIKKRINDLRKKKGKKPINFDAVGKRLASKIRKTVGDTLDRAGIKTIDQFNKAAGLPSSFGASDPSLSSASKKAAEELRGDMAAGNLKSVPGTPGVHHQDIHKDEFDGLHGLFHDNGKPTQDKGKGDQEKEQERQWPTRGLSSVETNLFEEITKRYQETAYPSLLEKKD